MRTLAVINWAKSPGGRYRRQGKNSAEEWLQEHLAPAFQAALDNGEQLLVDLDRVSGFGACFLDEAFGGLVWYYKHPPELVLQTLVLKCEEEPGIIADIQQYIQEAAEEE